MNDILQSPDKRLHAVSTKVINFDEAKKIAQQLIDVTRGVDKPFNFWLGMAAPQVGYDKRIVILRKSYQNYTVMVNPEIVDKKWFLPSVERCYSLKGMGRFLLKRYFWLRIKYQDLDSSCLSSFFVNNSLIISLIFCFFNQGKNSDGVSFVLSSMIQIQPPVARKGIVSQKKVSKPDDAN